jgi:signal transduction histidine kinase
MMRLKPIVEEAREVALEGRYAVRFTDAVDAAFEIDADAAQFFRILLNILRNAGEALGEKGGTISVSAARADAQAVIDISDSGPGIPAAVRERLFQPFAGSARAGGSGLGLAIARELARAHGGDILLIKSDQSGTQFQISIPDRAK